jgi:hypothetical protein
MTSLPLKHGSPKALKISYHIHAILERSLGGQSLRSFGSFVDFNFILKLTWGKRYGA